VERSERKLVAVYHAEPLLQVRFVAYLSRARLPLWPDIWPVAFALLRPRQQALDIGNQRAHIGCFHSVICAGVPPFSRGRYGLSL
jgi:hypothetical protein